MILQLYKIDQISFVDADGRSIGITAISRSKSVNYVILCRNYVTSFDWFNLSLIDKKTNEINHDKIKRNTQRIRTNE